MDEFLEDNPQEVGTTCDLNGKCVPTKIKMDRSIVERINKKIIIIEDGRQLLM
tara:strand:- start:413 stop:571 length:159 start_codon:yes stop_codon:yes gene_type:complete